MNYKGLSVGLGLFSLALGAAELFAPRRIARRLDAEDHRGVVRGFGVREVVSGLGILASPAASATVWNRVAGDAMDMGALALAARRSPRNRAIWGTIAFVAATTALDVLTARGLDEQTGKLLPVREPALA